MVKGRDATGRLTEVGLAAIAVAAAVVLFAGANADPDQLWHGYYHDRNGHYAFGQSLALAVRTIDPVWFVDDLLKAQVWPPVHGLVLAAVLLIGGIDHRLGIVPSLTGWVLTSVFATLIARRMFRDRDLGTAAAIIALGFTIASPAFRLLACDVMLECLGAGLSAGALWAYGRAMAPSGLAATPAQTASHWRQFALLLTALFFEKGNYWGLVVAAIGITHACNSDRAHWLAALRAGAQWFEPAKVVRVLRDPFVILAALMFGVVVYVYHRGPTAIVLLGRPVSLYKPDNLITATYAVLFIRFALTWRDSRHVWDPALGIAGRAVLYWHLAPIAVSFLLPRRLSAFIWFVGPANSSGSGGLDLLGGLLLYWHAFAEGFSVNSWAAAVALVLFGVGLAQVRRFPAGGQAAIALALVGIAGVVIHPQHQGRFLASWLFAVWIGAGAGGAIVLERLVPRRARLPLAGALGLAMAATLWRQPPPAAYATAIHPLSGPSDIDLLRPLLPALRGVRSAGFAATFGESELASWVAQENCRCKLKIEKTRMTGLASRQEARTLMAARVAASQAPLYILIDAPGSPYELPELGWTYARTAGIVDAMAAQDRYIRVATHALPRFGAEVSLWRRRNPGG